MSENKAVMITISALAVGYLVFIAAALNLFYNAKKMQEDISRIKAELIQEEQELQISVDSCHRQLELQVNFIEAQLSKKEDPVGRILIQDAKKHLSFWKKK